MKIKSLFLSLFVILLVASCSSDDNGGPANPKNKAVNYFPLTTANSWTYHNNINIEDQFQNESDETLTVTDSTTQAESVGYLFSSNKSGQDQGFMTAMLSNGQVNKVEGKVIYNGNIILQIPNVGDSISIPVHNLYLANQNKNSGDALSSVNDALSQNLSFNGMSIPATIEYTIKTTEGDVYENYPAGDIEYEDVISSNLEVHLSVSANILNMDMQVLINQKAFDVTNYFAKEVGLIYSHNDINIHFEDLSEFGIPLDSVVGTSTQTLDDFSVN